MKRLPYRPVITRDHKPGCLALRENNRRHWNTAWSYLEDVVKLDSLGRRTRPGVSGERWWLVRCNDTDCPAQILVHERSILERLPNTREVRR